MRRLNLPAFVLLVAFLFQSCQKDQTLSTQLDIQLDNALAKLSGSDYLSDFRLPEATDINAIPADPLNKITHEKIALGKMLYHEPGLGLSPNNAIGEGTYSCASCHFASAGFQAGLVQGIGEGGIGIGAKGEGRVKSPDYAEIDLDVQPIRSPAALNVAYQRIMLWNGQFGATGMNAGTESQWTPGTPKEVNNLGYEGVEIQAIAAQDVHNLVVNEDVVTTLGYKEFFDQAFSDWDAADRYSAEAAGLAIAAYERSLLASEAPFQNWLRGNATAMSDLEKEGAILFFGKAKCASCHTGPALNSEAFYAFGMRDLDHNSEEVFKTDHTNPEHLGRGGFTGRASDNYKFKVPQLYNLKDSPFMGHGGTFRSVRDVVAYKNEGVKENPRVPDSQLAPQFEPLGLSEEEIDAITAFLETGLYDPNLARYEPSSLPSGNCFPNNDSQSRADLGCN